MEVLVDTNMTATFIQTGEYTFKISKGKFSLKRLNSHQPHFWTPHGRFAYGVKLFASPSGKSESRMLARAHLHCVAICQRHCFD